MQADPDLGIALRSAGAQALAQALKDSRRDTLASFAVFEAGLPELMVPQRAELNPPLWELGHIGWFQEYWIGRFAERRHGHRADPNAAREPALRADADALYDSSHVAHDRRWQLPLPNADATRADLAAQLQQTLALLAGSSDDDDALYAFRLALLHEDMHHEAALYTLQSLGLGPTDARWQPAALTAPRHELDFDASLCQLGHAGPGFALDNELGAHVLQIAPFSIDSQAVSWDDYLAFVDDGGHADRRCWSDAGWHWRAAQPTAGPRHLRRDGDHWQRNRWGRWQPLDPAQAACHLSAFEADAWCAWAGRRLPSEAEWECAATAALPAYQWGAVWEWTASDFRPYPGFAAHPYRDYSAPWFGSRRVLRGASFATQPRLHHPRYRNYFEPGRSDLFAGFRSCAR
ncbi:MAG: selenoneine synthase SenA [Rubrivivax sp.]|nr:selenoneine synthase SenA [Rubrivivax sp.]